MKKNSTELLSEVKKFVESAASRDIKDEEPYHMHIYHLIENIQPNKYIEMSIKAYEYLLDTIIKREIYCQALLVVPLKSKNGAMASPQNIPRDINELEPNSLNEYSPPYIELDFSVWPDIFTENYKIPLDWKIFPKYRDVYGYYSEYRYVIDIENQGEIVRHVIFLYNQKLKF